MPVFRYKAIAPGGDTLQGQMEAGTAMEVIARLQEAGNVPISADEAGGGLGLGALERLFSGGGVSSQDIKVLTQQLATLLGAGLPLDRALQILQDLAASEPVARLIKSIRDQVRGGGSLSDALEAQHGVFPRLYVNMVRAGEAGGSLDVTLARLSEYLIRSKQLRDSIISALIYPSLLLVLAVGSLLVLLAYVVPQFMPIFEDLGGDLPLLTQMVLGVGRVVQGYWWALALAVVAIVLFVRRQMADPVTRLKWDRRFLKTRLVGDLISKVEMARLSRTVGTLLTNGVPLLGALAIGRNVMTNTVLSQGIAAAAKEVKTGDSLAHAMAAAERFPKLALQMIAVGEETGQLDAMLINVADAYDDEVKAATDRMMALLVPALTLALAALVGVIVMSILMAILSINELIA